MSRVRLTHDALDDLDAIWLWIARESEGRADRFVRGLHECVKRIARFPKLGRPRDDLLPGARSVMFYHHLIIYRVEGDGITVLRVVSGFRDLAVLLRDDGL